MSLRSVYNWWVHGNSHTLIPPVWYGFFAVLTLACHFLAPLIFKIETVEIKPVQQRPRSNKAISMRNPNFKKFCSSLPLESDPTVFIHGGHNLGYSKFLTLSEKDVLDAASSVRPELTQEKTDSTAEHPGTVADFDPAGVPQVYTGVLAEKNAAAHEDAAGMVFAASSGKYPVWIGLHGVIPGLKNPEKEAQNRRLFSSRDITGPTKLKVEPRQNGEFPPASRIIRSSGSTTLDFYAKRMLDQFLEKPGNAACFDRENNVVKVYWNEKAPVLHADSEMAMFFSGEEQK